MSVRRPAIASLSTTSGGALLVIVTVTLGFGLYVAISSDGILTPAVADAVSVPPLVKAEPGAASPPAQVAAMALPKPLSPQPISSDRGSRVRELQKALARAECYNGPVSGIWSDASKDAMRGFVQTVNAALPVDSPDEALVALVESNDTAKCARGRVIATGTLGTLVQPAALQQMHAASVSPTPQDTAIAAPQTPADPPTMIERAWAPAGMLIPPKDTTANATVAASAHGDTQPPVVAQTADNEPVPAQPDPAAERSSALHFEDNKALPAFQPADPSTLASSTDATSPGSPPAKPKKTKTAKRKPAKDSDVQSSINDGIDTLQRSLSSLF